MANDGDDVTDVGGKFYTRTAATRNAWSPIIGCAVCGITSAVDGTNQSQ